LIPELSMPTSESPQHPLFDAATDDVVAYRAVSSLAVAALLVGLASTVAMLNPVGLIVSGIGLGLGCLSLVRLVRAGPALVGRKAALAGLALSALSATTATTQWYVAQRLLRGEARRFAQVWFDALARGNPYQAQELTLAPTQRPGPEETFRDFYRKNPRWRDELKRYVVQAPVRALLALGPAAEIRYYETADQGVQDDRPWVQLTYAVTYDDPDAGRTSFFITLLMDRFAVEGGHTWRVMRVDGPVRPAGW
jgi:hypothetical protein